MFCLNDICSEPGDEGDYCLINDHCVEELYCEGEDQACRMPFAPERELLNEGETALLLD